MKTLYVFLLAGVGLVANGCGMVSISARYVPTGRVRPIVRGDAKLKLQVADVREKKVFFRTALGDTEDRGGGALLRLERPTVEIFDEGFTEALQAAGCRLGEDGQFSYSVGIKRFLATDKQVEKGVIETDILLEIEIQSSGSVLANKSIFERDAEKIGFVQAWQDVLPDLLSRSLSRAIESAVLDPELIATIERAGGLAGNVEEVRSRLAALPAAAKPAAGGGLHADELAEKRTKAAAKKSTSSPFAARYVAGLGEPEVVVSNKSDRAITVSLDGPKSESFTVQARSSVTKTLPAGGYSYRATAAGVSPASGMQAFVKNYRYTWTFMIIRIP